MKCNITSPEHEEKTAVHVPTGTHDQSIEFSESEIEHFKKIDPDNARAKNKNILQIGKTHSNIAYKNGPEKNRKRKN